MPLKLEKKRGQQHLLAQFAHSLLKLMHNGLKIKFFLLLNDLSHLNKDSLITFYWIEQNICNAAQNIEYILRRVLAFGNLRILDCHYFVIHF